MDSTRSDHTGMGRRIIAPESDIAAVTPEAILDPLDALLKQVIDGFFFLTDGHGAISKWGEPAELLFGMTGPQVLGRPMFDTLLDPEMTPEGRAWRGFLEEGIAPGTRSRVDLSGYSRSAGVSFPLELAFVPVKLDEGFDFSLFLEDLSFDLPLNLMLKRIRQQHPVVVRALGAASDDEAHPWEQWRTAGTMVVLRPLTPTPWVQAALAARAQAREEADAELEERLTETDPGIQGESIYELEDAAAVVARLLDAFQRIEELERTAAALPVELQAARNEADAVRARAEAAEREVREARTEVHEAMARLAPEGAVRARQELQARIERLESDRAELARRLNALIAERPAQQQLFERVETVERRHTEVMRQLHDSVDARVRRADEQIAGLDERVQAMHGQQAESAQGQAAALASEFAGLEERQDAADERLVGVAERLLASERDAGERDERHAEAVAELGRHLSAEQAARAAALAEAQEAREQRDGALSQRVGELAGDLARMRDEDTSGPQLQALAARVEQAAQERADALATLRQAQGDAVREIRAELERSHVQLAQERHADADGLRAAAEQAGARAQTLAQRLEGVERVGADQFAGAQAAVQATQALSERVESFERARAEDRAGAQRDFEQALAGLRSEVEARLATAAVARANGGEPVEAGELNALHGRLDELSSTATQAAGRADEARAAAQEAGRHALELFDGSRRQGAALGECVEQLRGETGALHGQVRDLDGRTATALARLDGLEGSARESADLASALAARVEQGASGLGEIGIRVEDFDGRLAATQALATTATSEAEAAGTHARAVREQLSVVREQAESSAGVSAAATADAAAARAAIGVVGSQLDAVARQAAEDSEGWQARVGELRARDEELHAKADELSAGVGAVGVLATGLEQQAADSRERIEQARSAADGARVTAGEAVTTAAQAVHAGAHVAERLQTAESALAEGLERLDGRVEALVDGAARLHQAAEATGQRVDGLQGDVARVGSHTEHALIETRTDIADLRDEASTLRGDGVALRALVAETAATVEGAAGVAAQEQDRIGDLALELAAMRSVMESYRKDLDDARIAAATARHEAEQARRAAESGKQAREAEGNKLNEAVAQLFGAAAAAGAGASNRRSSEANVRSLNSNRAAAAKPAPPVREPRAGFDDAAQPSALLGLDGRFKLLNPGFVKLIGYPEHEFTDARWPSVHDRATLVEQERQLQGLAAGELDTVPVQSSYLHGQGLMVLVDGDLALVRDADGQPLNLLLTARER